MGTKRHQQKCSLTHRYNHMIHGWIFPHTRYLPVTHHRDPTAVASALQTSYGVPYNPFTRKKNVVLAFYENGILAANAIMKIYLKWKFNINTFQVVN